MLFFTIKKIKFSDHISTTYSLGKKWKVLTVNTSRHKKRVYLFGKRVISLRLKKEISTASSMLTVLSKIKYDKLVIWFDHYLGGGTDVYALRHIHDLCDKSYVVLRIQSIADKDEVDLTLHSKQSDAFYVLKNFDELFKVLGHANFFKIIVNNLVGYKNTLQILKSIIELKKNSRHSVNVTFNLHDFQCICPSFNLVSYKNKFCNLDFESCSFCLFNILSSWNSSDKHTLKSGASDIKSWRDQWSYFFSECCDEIIAFSNSSKNIILKAHPGLQFKIQVNPHVIPYLRAATVEKHSGINIAFLGNINCMAKGYQIVKNLVSYCKLNSALSFFVVGTFKNPPANLTVVGKYEITNLPSIIENKNIDIIIIPSIWPETFSYTTSEAISLQIPVACFDYGAQADKVKEYSKGLILSSEEPEIIVNEIMSFLKH